MKEAFKISPYRFCFIYGLVTGLFSLFLFLPVYAEINEVDRETALKLIVMIEGQFDEAGNDKTLGGGIIFGRDDDFVYIATANHVVRKGTRQVQSLQVKFRHAPEQAMPAELLENFDDDLDLAVLRVKSQKSITKGSVGCIPFDRLADSDGFKRGVRVYPIGYPNGIPWAMPVLPDAIAQLTGKEFSFQSAFLSAGHSGGGVINESGELIGLILKDQPPFGSALKIETMLDALQEWRLPIQLRISKYGNAAPILEAIRRDDVMEVKWLIRGCHDVNISDKWGYTPLKTAIAAHRIDLVTLLLDNGANIDKWSSCETPLAVAIRTENMGMINFLLSRGATVMMMVAGCSTPLGLAIQTKRTRLVQTFLESRNWEHSRENKLLARELIAAAKLYDDWPRGLEMLLHVGADVNARNSDGQTALHAVTDEGHSNAIKVLLRSGAEVNAKDSGGKTALDLAMRRANHGSNDSMKVVTLLLSAGAMTGSVLSP